ncbi:MAG: arginine--tRNA ligase [Holophagales bacterium]|nr:arginine--tRNA ligase [Holophagales bacterium]MYG32259.1 arginine--tRNA ligase [Holophagales bacterium]MYI78572.1 arginine--tRNA ligase [Holophagales bacterium]
MLQDKRNLVAGVLRRGLSDAFGLDHDPVVEVPPQRRLGDLASPCALHLARELRQAPRAIAERLLEAVDPPAGFSRITVEGPGYLNFHLDRTGFAAAMIDAVPVSRSAAIDSRAKVIVEHTNINPNKAAHIGHLRNAVLGDVLARALRRLGQTTEVQNYIDDTGVQVADVVVGFLDLRGCSVADIEALPEPFDYVCWDIYSEVGRWYDGDPQRLELRRRTLHALETGEGRRAEAGRLVARRIVVRHLATMARIDIDYDLLTRESEILRLDFFVAAFEQLKETGAVRFEESGKNAGCWVMPLADSEEFQGLEDPDKVIVRSDGTVTYVGKDIAYQLWKFGLLGRDFEYARFGGGSLWETAPAGPDGGDGGGERFGEGSRVINVIDARQAYLQRIVRAGLEALGHQDEARDSIHFAYEMVALSAKTAEHLGFSGDARLEMSGRKGIGVKADDLLDQLEAKSRDEILERRGDDGGGEAAGEDIGVLARQIAVAALRFFMARATTTRVIAFDIDDATSFEGESGPYLQYSIVRARNIRRRLREEGLAQEVPGSRVAGLPAGVWSDDLWDLVLFASQCQETVERAAATLELSLIARHAVDLAQKFHAIYHRHPILHEQDADLRDARLAVTQVFERSLEALAAILGVPLPERM